jgi:hypothetical protein
VLNFNNYQQKMNQYNIYQVIRFINIKISLGLIAMFFIFSNNLCAQVKIGDNPSSINSSSLLELESSSKGLLIPRMTETERDAIVSPTTGLQIFNTTTNQPNFYNGVTWTHVANQKAYGSLYYTENTTATTFISAETYYILKADTFLTGSSNDVTTNPSTGRMTYTGTQNKHFHIVMNGSISSASNNQTMLCTISKNGVPIGSPIERKIATSGDVGAFSVHADLTLSTNDYVEVYLKNKTSTASLTMKHFYFFLMSMK